MNAPLFTVLAPVHRSPELLPFAAGSVLRQSRPELELFIVCDGAPQATVEAARDLAAGDRRVKVFAYPKGERHGEAWRHQALGEAQGRYVCQIGDDDLWFETHLEEAERLMRTADFGNLLTIQLRPDGSPYVFFGDLALPAVQAAMRQSRWNFFGPTSAVYRLEAYRKLAEGWAPAPEGIWTDLWMWRKFLALPGVRCATRLVATSLGFPASLRPGLDLAGRRSEIARYAGLIEDGGFRDELWRAALLDLAGQMMGLKGERYALAQRAEAAEADAAQLAAALAEVAAAAGETAAGRLARAALAARTAPPAGG